MLFICQGFRTLTHLTHTLQKCEKMDFPRFFGQLTGLQNAKKNSILHLLRNRNTGGYEIPPLIHLINTPLEVIMKYILERSESLEVDGHVLYRVKYEDSTLGGWLESESNLDSSEGALVLDNATVYENAKVCGSATALGKAQISGEAELSGHATAKDFAMIFDNAVVYGHAIIYGEAHICGNAKVFDNVEVFGDAMICEDSIVYENAKVYNGAIIKGNIVVRGDIKVTNCTLV
jgi:NDP-sugar pyrophosphorylase family protein